MTRHTKYFIDYEASQDAEVSIHHIRYNTHSFKIQSGKGQIVLESMLTFKPTAFEISVSNPVLITDMVHEHEGAKQKFAFWRQTVGGVDLYPERTTLINTIGTVRVDMGDNLYGWDISPWDDAGGP